MADMKEVGQALDTYIRPLTFPVAIKMVESEGEIPEKTRRPFQQMGTTEQLTHLCYTGPVPGRAVP